MTSEELQRLIAAELKRPYFAMTRQFLAVHQVSYLNGQPLLKSVVPTPEGGQRTYLAVEGQRFYLSMYFSPATEQLAEVDTEPYHDIWLRTSSMILEPEELAAFTKLTPARQWRKNDWLGAVRNSQFNGLDLCRYIEPNLFEHMLS